jgi:hypothetical protein
VIPFAINTILNSPFLQIIVKADGAVWKGLVPAFGKR